MIPLIVNENLLCKPAGCGAAPGSCGSIIHVLSQLLPMRVKELPGNVLLGVNFISLARDKWDYQKYLYGRP